jgi:hypothetical protein
VPRLIKIAIACGAIPLVAGTAIYFLWRVTRWESLMALGLSNILVGLALFAVGVGCLLCQSMREESNSDGQPIDAGLRNLLVACLLLVNFPMAFVYGLSAMEVMSRYTLQVTNNSGRPVERLLLSGPNLKVELGEIPIGATIENVVDFRGEGPLLFAAELDGEAIDGEVDGYVCSGIGGDTKLRFLPEGKFEVQRKWGIEFLARD